MVGIPTSVAALLRPWGKRALQDGDDGWASVGGGTIRSLPHELASGAVPDSPHLSQGIQGVPLKSTPLIFFKCQIWEKMEESQSRPPKICLSVRFG